MTVLETERLILRNFQSDDWAALHEMIVQFESSDLAAYDQSWPTSPEEIKKITDWFASGEIYLVVCLKDSGQFIGFVSLNPEKPSEQRVFNIGYIFNFLYHRKGYAAEACRAVLRHAFQRLQAGEVVSGTAAANLASCHLLEKLGFKKTSEALTSFRKTQDGKAIEFLSYSYALSKDEWEPKSQ